MGSPTSGWTGPDTSEAGERPTIRVSCMASRSRPGEPQPQAVQTSPGCFRQQQGCYEADLGRPARSTLRGTPNGVLGGRRCQELHARRIVPSRSKNTQQRRKARTSWCLSNHRLRPLSPVRNARHSSCRSEMSWSSRAMANSAESIWETREAGAAPPRHVTPRQRRGRGKRGTKSIRPTLVPRRQSLLNVAGAAIRQGRLPAKTNITYGVLCMIGVNAKKNTASTTNNQRGGGYLGQHSSQAWAKRFQTSRIQFNQLHLEDRLGWPRGEKQKA